MVRIGAEVCGRGVGFGPVWRGFGRLVPLLLTIALAACTDAPMEPTVEAVRAGPETSDLLGTSATSETPIQSERMDQIARSLALAFGNTQTREQVLFDLRDSPFPEHRIHLSEYLRGDRGASVKGEMAQRLGMSSTALDQALDSLPELEIWVPRTYDRVTWSGDDSVVLIGLEALDRGAANSRPLRGFDAEGEVHRAELWRGVPAQPVVLVYPVAFDFGSEPEEVRRAAPTQVRETISLREHEFASVLFAEGGGPSRVHGSHSEEGILMMQQDCDPDNIVIPCDPDPDPPAWGGYDLPWWLTWNDCTSPIGILDYDGDGFDDNCELELAQRFAPVLVTNNDDITTREPAWTAAPVPSSQMVVIFYALSYHLDLGCAVSACGSTGYTSHYGDSEWIVIVVEPKTAGSSQWRVVEASLSAHWNTLTDSSKTVPRWNLNWADEYGGRPLIWVSKWKHANYKSHSSCSDKPWDTCSGSSPEPSPVWAGPDRHLGLSWGNTLLNCVESIAYYPDEECYWVDQQFRGWHGERHIPDPFFAGAGPYLTALNFFEL